MTKLTEDEVVVYLSNWLQSKGWTITEKCTGHTHGIDILAEKDGKKLFVEAKGARGNPKSHVTTREYFDSGQLKTHLGKAIIKLLELKSKYPGNLYAIAQPDDEYLREHLEHIIQELNKLGFMIYWVKSAEEIIEEK